MQVVVFDIETSNVFDEVERHDPALLSLALIGVYDSRTDTYSSYLEHELPKLWPLLEHADALVGWNSDYFDIPLLNKYYPGDLTHIKSIDLMNEVKKSFGRRLKLDAVASATLGTRKGGSGLDALSWWRKGEIDRVREYCLQDVALTKKLFDFAYKNKYLCVEELGRPIKIFLDTSSWEVLEKRAITHTLPF